MLRESGGLNPNREPLTLKTPQPNPKSKVSIQQPSELDRPPGYLIFSLLALIKDTIWEIVKIMVPFWVP